MFKFNNLTNVQVLIYFQCNYILLSVHSRRKKKIKKKYHYMLRLNI